MRAWALAPLLAVTLVSGSALAIDRKACISAADDGQKLRDDGKLKDARDKFITCADKACPAAISKQCADWVGEVDHDTPTIAFRAKDASGKEIFDVQVEIDGQPIGGITPKATAADPGSHKIRFNRADGTSVEETFLLRPAEKDRIIELTFKGPAAPVGPSTPPPPIITPPPASGGGGGGFRFPALAWVGLSVMVVGGVGTGVFAVMANSDENKLRTTCAPFCNPSDQSSIDTKIILANVSLGLGIAGLGLTVISTIVANVGKKEAPPATSGLVVAPLPNGAALGWAGRF